MTSDDCTSRQPYHPPQFACHDLKVVTLGGSPGPGDSGGGEPTQPPGSIDGSRRYNDDDEFGDGHP